MGAKLLDMAVQRLGGVNLDFGWICQGAISAISSTVGTILFGGDSWEDVFGSVRAGAQGQPRAKHPDLCLYCQAVRLIVSGCLETRTLRVKIELIYILLQSELRT